MVILGEKKKFSKHIIFFHYEKYIFKKKLKKIFLRTWSAKSSPRTFRRPCLAPHLHIHIIYKKAANISQTIPRTSYAKCSRTFRRPSPVKTGLRPPKYSHRTKSAVQYVRITYTMPYNYLDSSSSSSSSVAKWHMYHSKRKISSLTLTIPCDWTSFRLGKIFPTNRLITYFQPSRVLTLYIRASGSICIRLGATVVQRDWCSDSGRGVYSQPVLTLVCVGFVIRVWTVLLDTLARFYNGRVELVCWRVTKMLTDCVCVVLLRVREL